MSAPIIKRGLAADAAKEADSERLKIVILDDDKTVLAHAEMDQSIARALDIPRREPDIVAPAPEEIANSNLRCLFVNSAFDHSLIGAHDLLIAPQPFPGSSFLDFDQHTSVFNASYHWGLGHIDELVGNQSAPMETLFELSRH